MKFLFLHGSNVAAFGEKVELLQKNFGHENVIAINYPHDPKSAIALFEYLISSFKKNNEEIILVGSSQGGFFAIYLSNKFNVPAILINPMIKEDAPEFEFNSEVHNYVTNEKYIYKKEFHEFLKSIEIPKEKIKKNKLFIYCDEKDECCDPKITQEYFEDFYVKIFPNGCHRFDHMKEAIEDMKKKLNQYFK